MLEYVATLDELDTSGIEPTAHAIALDTPVRSDEAAPAMDPALAVACAPESAGTAFVVPKVLDEDDRIRQFVIRSIMCNFELDFAALKARFGIDYERYFARENRALDATIEPAFYRREADRLRITPEGQLFVRNICMAFDRYLDRGPEKPIYSKTV